MGQTLSARVEWSSFTASAPDGSQSNLLTKSLVNEDLLHDLVRYVEYLTQNYPIESKIEFKKPLQYVTYVLKPNLFLNEKAFQNGVVVTSLAQRQDGLTYQFQLDQIASGVFTAKISNFDILQKILTMAGEHKLREAQDILQGMNGVVNLIGEILTSIANRDLMTSITGFSSVDASATLMEAVELLKIEGDPFKKDQSMKSLKLLTILNGFDLKMLSTVAKQQASITQITMNAIEQEYLMLKSFCGKKKDHALISIEYDSDYVFANGLRSPPWRQVYGELCYLLVQTFDHERLTVTASKKEFFVNKGYYTDDTGMEKLNYDKSPGSGVYPSLMALLRAQSSHFDKTIDKQEFVFKPETKPKLAVPLTKNDLAAEKSLVAAMDEERRHTSADTSEDRTVTIHRKPAEHKATAVGKQQQQQNENGKKKKDAKKNHDIALGPSAKWRYVPEPPKFSLILLSNINVPREQDEDRHHLGMSSGKNRAMHENMSRAEIIARRRAARSLHLDADEEDGSDSEAVHSGDDDSGKRQEINEIPAEFWQIQKLVKYLRVGNQTATIIATCAMRDFDLQNDSNQLAIRDVGGLEILVNLLDTEDPRCIRGALQVLKVISQNVQIRAVISDLDGVLPMVELLDDTSEEIKCLSAETLANCAKNATNRRLVRRYGGIKKLVRLLKSKNEEVARCGAAALCSCSKSNRSKESIEAAGAIPLLGKLLQSKNENLLVPVVGILQECAVDETYRLAIRNSGMIRFLVENLSKSKSVALQTHCASAIFKCAEDSETRLLVQKFNGIEPLAALLDNPANTNKDLLVAVTGAVWKVSQNAENVLRFIKLGTIKRLCALMESQPEEVLVNIVGALGACAQIPEGRSAIRESNGITPLVNLLTRTDSHLLVNVTKAVGACSLDNDCMITIDRLDGVRLLWSLLKSPNPAVQSSAAWAISPCIEHAKDAGEMVRSFVGGLELIVSLLKSENNEVLASVCSALANIANDEENLAVITDHGVVPMLAKLTNTKDDRLKKNLAAAIARCCHWGLNRVAFGSAKAVAPLVKFLKSSDKEVHRGTALALHQLSMDADNCITMHENGVVPLLLGMVGSPDEVLQEAAAGTIGNIRKLALASEKATLAQ